MCHVRKEFALRHGTLHKTVNDAVTSRSQVALTQATSSR